MNTSDFFQPASSKKLSETISKQFGIDVDLKKYDREQLENVRNQLRTIQFQHEQNAGINDLLTNEAYQKNQAMLQLINTRIKEMLGEDIKKLKDKMLELSEGKKGVKVAKHPKGSKGSGDGNLANNYPPYDKVTRGDVVAGATGKDQKGGKVKEDNTSNETPPKGKWPGTPGGYEPGQDKAKPGEKRTANAGRHTVKTTATGKTVTKNFKEESEDKETMTSYANKPDAEKAYDAAVKTHGKENVRWGDKNKHGVPTIMIRKSKKSVEEAAKSCNHTAEGKMCPVHKMKECPMEEGMKMVKGKKGEMVPAFAADGKGKKDLKKKSKMEESQSIFRHNVRIVNENLTRLINENEEEKAKAITAASDIVNDYTSWMQRVGQYQTKALIELADAIRSDFGAAEAETFKQTVSPALAATLETLMAQREVISNAVAVLAGEQSSAPPMGTEPAAGAMEPEMGPAEPAEPDAMNEPAPDEFAGSEPASTSREMRESRFVRKLAESHSIISKLAR